MQPTSLAAPQQLHNLHHQVLRRWCFRNPGRTHQLRLVVNIPLFTGFEHHPRVLYIALGFLNHKYEQTMAPLEKFQNWVRQFRLKIDTWHQHHDLPSLQTFFFKLVESRWVFLFPGWKTLKFFVGFFGPKKWWLVPLVSQNGNRPPIFGVKMKKCVSCHHLEGGRFRCFLGGEKIGSP